MMKSVVAGTATTLFAVVALATASQAAASPDDDFLKALTRSGVSFPAQAAPGVISGGHSVCQGFAAGKSYTDEVANIAPNTGGSPSIAGVFVRAATKAFCPEYNSVLP